MTTADVSDVRLPRNWSWEKLYFRRAEGPIDSKYNRLEEFVFLDDTVESITAVSSLESF